LKFSIQKKELQGLLLEHIKVVPIRTTLPVLMCALFVVEKQNLTIKTTDLDQTIISSTKITNEKTGSIAIPTNRLFEIINALPDGEIKINANEDNLIEINNNEGVYKITGRTPEEFPENSETETTQNLNLTGEDFLDIIEKTVFDRQMNHMQHFMFLR
jgi:DNA polymerase-3 subunit beta